MNSTPAKIRISYIAKDISTILSTGKHAVVVYIRHNNYMVLLLKNITKT